MQLNYRYNYKDHFELCDCANIYANNCLIRLRDGEGKSIGPCVYYLYEGVCYTHGEVFKDYPYKRGAKDRKRWYEFWKKV